MTEKRKGYKTPTQQVEANKRYLQNNPEAKERKKRSTLKSNTKAFISVAKEEEVNQMISLFSTSNDYCKSFYNNMALMILKGAKNNRISFDKLKQSKKFFRTYLDIIQELKENGMINFSKVGIQLVDSYESDFIINIDFENLEITTLGEKQLNYLENTK